ncbi:MAG: hypothetical protein U0V64_16125 [Cyclobacteriaceae bacterium]
MKADEQKLQNLKVVVIYSTLGLGTATSLFLLGRHLYKKTRANISQRNDLEVGDPATFAKQLKMAFDNDNYMGWGTNEPMVIQVFNEIPSKNMYTRKYKEYTNLYGRV